MEAYLDGLTVGTDDQNHRLALGQGAGVVVDKGGNVTGRADLGDTSLELANDGVLRELIQVS